MKAAACETYNVQNDGSEDLVLLGYCALFLFFQQGERLAFVKGVLELQGSI